MTYTSKTAARLGQMADGFERDGLDDDAAKLRAALAEIERLKTLGTEAAEKLLESGRERARLRRTSDALRVTLSGALTAPSEPAPARADGHWWATLSNGDGRCGRCAEMVLRVDRPAHERACWA